MNRHLSDTRLVLRERGPSAEAKPASQGSGLPADLVEAAIRRVQVLALTFGLTFFCANFVPPIIVGRLGELFSSPISWMPGMVSIAAAAVVFYVVKYSHWPPQRLTNVALAFGVVGSYGIAMAEFLHLAQLPAIDWTQQHAGGLSWVAVWTLSFLVMLPTTPRKALVAVVLSMSAVPVVVGIALSLGGHTMPPLWFFVWTVFPYLISGALALFCARVVYRLGRAVGKARELGSYRLTELLGRGGMGEVWKAEHRMLARPAAVKLITQQALAGTAGESGSVAMRRFEREAQATALLRSPHTVELFDFGIADDGAFYYVMELLDGFDLDSLVERFGPLSSSRAVHVLRQICHSLGEAHAAGLVHRDIKPANVFACRYGRELDFVKVLDFGLVKGEKADQPEAIALTAAHVAGGTPAFMSPEQILGTSPVDGRSDLYAVGCVAYWLITGQLVFEGKTAMQLATQHAHDPPAAPSTRTEIEVPEALDRLILDCLAKDPAARPQTADELEARLAELDGLGVERWSVDEARSWWSTHAPVSQGTVGATEPTPVQAS